jgi:hypothetical protein
VITSEGNEILDMPNMGEARMAKAVYKGIKEYNCG